MMHWLKVLPWALPLLPDSEHVFLERISLVIVVGKNLGGCLGCQVRFVRSARLLVNIQCFEVCNSGFLRHMFLQSIVHVEAKPQN